MHIRVRPSPLFSVVMTGDAYSDKKGLISPRWDKLSTWFRILFLGDDRYEGRWTGILLVNELSYSLQTLHRCQLGSWKKSYLCHSRISSILFFCVAPRSSFSVPCILTWAWSKDELQPESIFLNVSYFKLNVVDLKRDTLSSTKKQLVEHSGNGVRLDNPRYVSNSQGYEMRPTVMVGRLNRFICMRLSLMICSLSTLQVPSFTKMIVIRCLKWPLQMFPWS